MVDVLHPVRRQAARASSPTQQFFQRDWQIYRKVIDNNYLFHREAYSCLHHVLVHEMAKPFTFLDIACGDADASLSALQGTGIGAYEGIDLSRAALDIADRALPRLGCPFVLNEGDFTELLPERLDPVDVAWIGLSLHHLQHAEKLALLRTVRLLTGEGGRLLIYENTSPDGEEREGWMERWDAQRPFWTALDADEWEIVCRHVSTADYPETVSGWHALGHDAGFERVRELFVAPTDLFRLYAFEG